MVQPTLDATKSFIFDVRPMVLDDLGLVPTLRRARARRGRRAGVPVDFDSMGADRRLPMDLESGLFRMVEESLAGYLTRPDPVRFALDWTDKVTLECRRPRDPRRRRRGARGAAGPTRRPTARSCRRRCAGERRRPAAGSDDRGSRDEAAARRQRARRPAGEVVAGRAGAGRRPSASRRAARRRLRGPDHRRSAAGPLSQRLVPSPAGHSRLAGFRRPGPGRVRAHPRPDGASGLILAVRRILPVFIRSTRWPPPSTAQRPAALRNRDMSPASTIGLVPWIEPRPIFTSPSTRGCAIIQEA